MLPSVAVNLLCEKAIKAIAAGKPEEIGVLYDHTYRLIYSVAYGVLRNHADAEDAAQETLCIGPPFPVTGTSTWPWVDH